MSARDPYDRDPETTPERPSSFREILHRDRRLLSRRQMDRRLRDRAAERNETGDGESGERSTTYFPALSRMLRGGTIAEFRAIVLLVVLVVAAFFFGRWVGQQDVVDPAPQSAGITTLI